MTTYDVILKPGPFSSYDTEEIYHVHRYNETQGILAMYMWHTDMEVWVAIDLLFCDDINTIFITDYYGWNAPSFSPEITTPYIRRLKKKHKKRIDTIDLFSHYYMQAILEEMYPTYRSYFYNKGHFKQVKKRYMDVMLKHIPDFPKDIVENIANKLKPDWFNYTHKATADIWRMKKYFNDWNGMFSWRELKYVMAEAKEQKETFRGKIVRNT